MKTKLISILIIVLLTSGFSIHRIFHHSSKNNNSNSLVKVTIGDITEKIVAVGTITPEQSVAVKSSIPGTVAKLFHDAGDYVKKDEPLLEVKPEPTPDQYAMAKQKVATDIVALDNATANLKRYQFLLKKMAISKDDQDYAKAKSDYDTMKLDLELDKEKLSLLEKGKAFIGGRSIANVIKSPVDGYILERNVDAGAPVIAQSNAQQGDTLFTIANMNHLIFKGQVNEIDASKIHKNMPATIQIAALPHSKIQGTLTHLALQSIQENNKSSNDKTNSPFNVGFQIKITHLQIPHNLRLLAGYSATANIAVNSAKNILLFPERLLYFEKDKTYVWINNKNNQPKKQFIEIGLSDGMQVQVISGLVLGDSLLPAREPAASS